jgi:RHS repeat-associated protein
MRSIRFALLLLAAVPAMSEVPLPRPSVPPPASTAAAAAFEPGTDDALRTWDSGNYAYDGAGNITSIGTLTYTYDGWLRLVTSAKTGSSSQAFSYDTYGNLKRIATAGALTRLPAVNAATNRLDGPCPNEPNSVCLSGTYDEAGNQTGDDGAFQYEFDELNMMRRLSGVARNEVYIYTADDERVATVRLFGGTPDWQYTLRGADAKVLREFRTGPSGIEWKQDWIHAGGRQLASLRATTPAAPPTLRHFHLDHLGSTRLITDATARRLAELRFEAFGEEAPDSHPFDERLKFTGHERDDAGPGDVRDLDYMHARFYGVGAGRFLSVDPTWISADLLQPQTWNRYSYALNNPVNMTDPDGKCPICVVVLVGVAGGLFLGVGPANAPGPGDTIQVNPDPSGISGVMQGIGLAGAGNAATRIITSQIRSRHDAEVTQAARARADQAQSEGKSGGAAAAYRTTDGKIHTGVSGSRTSNAPQTQQAVDSVPGAQQSPFHGKCAECNAISNAERAGSPISGGTMRTVNIRKSGDPAHGTPKPPCSTCEKVLEILGITYK